MLSRLWKWLVGGESDREVLINLMRESMTQSAERDARAAANARLQTELLTNWLEMFKPKTPAKGWINDDRNMALREQAEKLESEIVPVNGDGSTEVERINELMRMMDRDF